MQMMVGLTYDLRAEYLAMGYSETETRQVARQIARQVRTE